MGIFDTLFGKGAPKPQEPVAKGLPKPQDATYVNPVKKVEGAYKCRKQRLDEAEAAATGKK